VSVQSLGDELPTQSAAPLPPARRAFSSLFGAQVGKVIYSAANGLGAPLGEQPTLALALYKADDLSRLEAGSRRSEMHACLVCPCKETLPSGSSILLSRLPEAALAEGSVLYGLLKNTGAGFIE